MKIKYNHEIISGIVFALISSFLWFSIPTQVKTMEKTAITAQTLPKIAIEKEELTVTKESFHSAAFKKELRSILYCLFLVAYCFMVKPLGFVISTVILVLAIMVYYGARKWYYYAIPLAMVGIVYYVFRVVLHVSLP